MSSILTSLGFLHILLGIICKRKFNVKQHAMRNKSQQMWKKISITAISAAHRNRWDYFIDLQRIQDLILYLQREMFSNIAWEVTSGNIQADCLLSQKVETPFRKSFKNVRLYSS